MNSPNGKMMTLYLIVHLIDCSASSSQVSTWHGNQIGLMLWIVHCG